jgi:hypothetical protein
LCGEGRRRTMGDFVGAALGFPAVLFSFLLVVVVGYWVLVLTGTLGVDDESGPDGDGQGVDAWLDRLGLSGAPFMVVVSVLVVVAWFVSLIGTALLNDAGVSTGVRVVISLGVLVGALILAVVVARLLVRPLQKLFDSGPEVSRNAFIGRECVIRTGQVSGDFGQAEVTAADGSSAVVQVRQTGHDTFTAGTRAVIYDYDVDGEFFWVVPAETAAGPDPSPH